MKRMILVLSLIFAAIGYTQTNVQVSEGQAGFASIYSLKQRQPNWRSEILKSYATGTPESILLYEPLRDGGEKPVKQLFFHENGHIRSEVDVIAVDPESPGAKVWNSSLVPHRGRVYLSPEGQIQHTAEYLYGLLNGTDRMYFPSGKVSFTSQYVNGILDGVTKSYFENEQLKEEVHYQNGQAE